MPLENVGEVGLLCRIRLVTGERRVDTPRKIGGVGFPGYDGATEKRRLCVKVCGGRREVFGNDCGAVAHGHLDDLEARIPV
jgi:hypothetical protein